jgi:ABC-type microcin C transport system permease subunit YejE
VLVTPASKSKKHRPPTTGAALVAQTRAKNRWMAIGIASFVIMLFVAVMLATVLNERRHAAQHHAASLRSQ